MIDPVKLMAAMMSLSHKGNQVVGEKSEYYVTLAQLENALLSLRRELEAERQGKGEPR